MSEYAAALARIRASGLYRENPVYKPLDATHVEADGKRYLVLSSNNYLEMCIRDRNKSKVIYLRKLGREDRYSNCHIKRIRKALPGCVLRIFFMAKFI